jgi:hypothetical protein
MAACVLTVDGGVLVCLCDFCQVFWVSSYHELNDIRYGGHPGHFVVFSQVVNLLLMLDFFYYYVKR